MKAIQLPAPWQVKAIEIPEPSLKAGEALIRVKAAGICGSDIGAFRGTNPLVSYPRVIGHEIVGEVIALAKDAADVCVGDHVIVDPYLYCNACYPCGLGRTNCCVDLKVLGVHVDGGMCEYFAHPANMLVKLPKDMSWELAPLAEPLTIALHGLHRGGLKAGEHIAISGAGPIGLLAAMGALHYGAKPILIDPIEERLAFARQLGVTDTVNPIMQPIAETIAGYTDGRMAEVVMEASGANAAIVSTLELVSNAGRIVLTGWPKTDTPLNTGIITKKEVDIRGARTSAGEFEEAIELIYHNKVNVQVMLSKTIALDEVPETIIDIEKNPGNYLKVNVCIE